MEGCSAFLVVSTCLLLLTGGARTIQVVEEPGLHVAENGTVTEIILDCPYILEENDNSGLTIKWYQVGNPIPVYQWIVSSSPPQALGILEGRLDLSYKASEDENHRHRALKIINPSTELSGQYQCKISTFDDEKDYLQKLIIYSKPQVVEVWTEQREDNVVTVVCEVDQVYPQPNLHLCQRSADSDCINLSGVKEVNSWSRGSYNMTVEREVHEDTLDGLTTFECVVTIPDTKVEMLDHTKYQPRLQVQDPEEVKIGGGSEVHSAMTVLVGIALLAVWRV
ncbi:uncharacterized protein LOC121855759 isoform X1 [Homarus americanus]|uniref:uncharacterized protein LOC121855759 isoform X1 n=1 Tax=Homarus americanus TaxID=6706 RepID=UPI001C43A7A7|nr:uncharacterized protein LOC121855759 isoform X1 [Homarus americanus]